MTPDVPRRLAPHLLRASAVLVALLFLAPTSAAAPALRVVYGLEPTHQFATSLGDLQGVTINETHVFVFSTHDIAVYTRNGTLVTHRDTTSDGSYGAHTGDGVLVGDRIYTSTSDWPQSLYLRKAAIAVYNATDLSYVTEWKPQGTTYTGAGGGVGYKDGYLWWPFLHKNCSSCASDQTIRKIDPATGTQVASYDLDGAPYYAYQTADWISDTLLMANIHGGRGRDYSDLYEWDGSGFDYLGMVDHVSWESTNETHGTEYGSQGFAVERDGPFRYIWWVGRAADGDGDGIGDVVRIPAYVLPGVPSLK